VIFNSEYRPDCIQTHWGISVLPRPQLDLERDCPGQGMNTKGREKEGVEKGRKKRREKGQAAIPPPVPALHVHYLSTSNTV